jgi:competence protein ComEA
MMRNTWVAAALTAAMVIGAGMMGRVDATDERQTAKPAPAPVATSTTPLDLNAATAADLQKLPGIGPALAARIVEYRQKAGGFKKVEELMNVQGIGEASFLKLKSLVAIAPAKTAER